ncbi:hypothetical protein ACFV1L_29200 [Kitasatospora sp. NPDC059646]|uniref:hypothetical protein n=1 Tax=Kitasatospora sp. NPDC059646 TaxID=3346893 RepID=UPI0036844D26
MIHDRALALRRLTFEGYRGPLLAAALLAVVVALPDGKLHTWFQVLPVFLVVAVVPLLLIAVVVVGATVTGPTSRPRRPGTSVLLGVALGCAAVLLGLSVPGADVGLLGFGVTTLLGLPFAWLLWQAWASARNGRNPSGRWRWAVAPLLVAGTVLTATQADLAGARFELARPALTDWAEHALAAGAADPEWVAGYRLAGTELVGGGVTFAIGGSGLFAPHGYAYFPSGTPARGDAFYTPLGDGWFAWEGPDHF